MLPTHMHNSGPRLLKTVSVAIVVVTLIGCASSHSAAGASSKSKFEGLYLQAFEVSSFVPCGEGAPGYGRGWWLNSSDDFYAQYRRLAEDQTGVGKPTVVYVRFSGRLSAPGGYGHLNQYEREVSVTALQEMLRRDTCPK